MGNHVPEQFLHEAQRSGGIDAEAVEESIGVEIANRSFMHNTRVID
jgi:hypothetical protein